VTMDVKAMLDVGDESKPYAQVEIAGVIFTIHESLVDADCVNVEIDHDSCGDAPQLRMHVNDGLVFDSAVNLGATIIENDAQIVEDEVPPDFGAGIRKVELGD
jgi:hypothetical protein